MSWKTNPFHFDGFDSHFARLEDKKSRLDALRPLSAAALRNIQNSLTLEWTYHSNSIEGNTLTLQETKMVVEDGLTIKGKSLREHFEAVNHHEAVVFTDDSGLPIPVKAAVFHHRFVWIHPFLKNFNTAPQNFNQTIRAVRSL